MIICFTSALKPSITTGYYTANTKTKSTENTREATRGVLRDCAVVALERGLTKCGKSDSGAGTSKLFAPLKLHSDLHAVACTALS